MAVLKWLIAGTLGAGIGGGIWVLLGYFANLEVGYVAWGIGLLAGLGVRWKMEAQEVNAAAGIAAVAAAVLVIAGSKYIVVRLHVENLLGPILAAEERVDPIDYVAGDIVEERELAGEPVEWPEAEVDADGELIGAGYPADVVDEARQRWEAMPERERADYLTKKRDERAEQMAMIREQINDDAFKDSFSPFDLLWFGLAVFTAFKVGRGAEPAADTTQFGEQQSEVSADDPSTGPAAPSPSEEPPGKTD